MKKLVIDKKDLIHNINILKSICKNVKIIAMLKGNGYGLDLVKFATVLLDNGIETFAISELFEGIELRKAGFKNEIMLLTPPKDKEEAKLILENNLIGTIGSFYQAELFNSLSKDKINVQLKLDTGFGRFGFVTDNIKEIAIKLKEYQNIEICGTFSHLSNSFGKDTKSADIQIEKYNKAIKVLNENGIDTKLKHICNSCGALRFPNARFDAVRIGSAFLGRLPLPKNYGLKRIAHLKCDISDIKTLPKGSNVGYADTFKTKRQTKIAIVQIGYKDGYGVEKSKDTFRINDILRYGFSDLKNLGKKIFVKVNGENVPIIGRISMFNIVLDVTDINCNIGDDVILECNPILLDSSIIREYI